MSIAVFGTERRIKEFNETSIQAIVQDSFITNSFDCKANAIDVVFELNADDEPTRLQMLLKQKDILVIACAAKKSLSQMINLNGNTLNCNLIGINALPGFINRPVWELSFNAASNKTAAENVLNQLNINYRWVADRVGMGTPRVVCMIINEAAWMFQEGGASQKDIDNAMRLGTNYPFGPFEWLERIGIKNVVEVLLAMQTKSGAERYRIADYLLERYHLETNHVR